MRSFFTTLFLFLLCISPVIAHPAWGIIADREGNLFFADIGHNGRGTVWKLTADGELIALFKDFHAHNVSMDKDGNLYTAHGEGDHTLLRIAPDGSQTELINTRDIETFFGGNCTVSPNGNIYFGIRHHIWKYIDGKAVKASDHYLEWNQAVFVDENENIYVPDIGQSGDLYRLSPDGEVVWLATDLISTIDRPRDKHNDVLLGMNKDRKGNIYICETAGRRIVRVSPGQDKGTFYQAEAGWTPTALCFRHDTTFIMEYGTLHRGPRIVRHTSSDTEIIFDYQTHISARGSAPGMAFRFVLLLILPVGFLIWIMRYRERV